MSLIMSTIIPITIFAFTLPLPYLPASPALGAHFMTGTGMLLAGLLVYNSEKFLPFLSSLGAPKAKPKLV